MSNKDREIGISDPVKETNDYGFYSRKLSKVFDSIEDLKSAESEYEAAQKAELAKKDQKKELAHLVEDAYKNYVTVVSEESKKLEEAQRAYNEAVAAAKNKYLEARNDFIETYGSYHMTFKDNEPVVDTVKHVSLADDIFSLFSSFPRLL